MKYPVLIPLLAMFLVANSYAQSRIFRCGNEYTNNATEAQARGCKVVEGGNVTVVEGTRVANTPAPVRVANAPQATQRVDNTEQRARDNDARTILEAELKKAEALVATGIAPEAVYAELQKNAVLKTKPVEHKAVALDPKAYSRGPKTAKVTIVQFSDFQCPFCKRAEPTMDELLKAYPKDVRIEWRNLPLSFHQDAELAAEAALEAGAQKGSAGFFKMHDLIFDGHGRPDGLKRPALEGYAKSMGLDMGKFGRALDGHVHLASIKADQATAQAAGISGTPGFVVNGTFI